MIKEENNIKGLILKIQRYSIHDGPGIRTLVYMKGCPLRCLWCCNPESQKDFPEIAYLPVNCLLGKSCIRVCPKNALEFSGSIIINRSKCDNCALCVETCKNRALIFYGKTMGVEDVFEEVTKDILFYRNSGGGVTIGGGEPTYQPIFVRQLLRKCHAIDIHTAIETSLFSPWKNIEMLLPFLDLVYLDIKHIDPKMHRKTTGVNNNLILENARRLSKMKVPMIMRIPIIPGINDTEKNLRETLNLALTLDNLNSIELLPYHAYGVAKYGQLGIHYSLNELRSPTKEYMAELKEKMENSKIEIQIGG